MKFFVSCALSAPKVMRRELVFCRSSSISRATAARSAWASAWVAMAEAIKADAVLHRRSAQIRQLQLLAMALLVQSCLWIRGSPWRLARPFLAMKVRSVIVGTTLFCGSSSARPGLGQHAIDNEAFVDHAEQRR